MEQLAFTEFLNHLLGGPVLACLRALGIQPRHPAALIPNAVAMEVLVVLLLTLFFIAVRLRLSVDRPGPLQHVMEGIEGFADNLGREIIGHGYQPYIPYLVTLG
ncbi:MAG TPA: F0F1 ATP synthase subunit A, partial [Terriglobales bacterium]|nr:F0F1 ATP synthase subunit A [Terriglobales bacterium]